MEFESDTDTGDETAPLLHHAHTTVQDEAEQPKPKSSDALGNKEEHRRLVRTVCMVLFYIVLGLYAGIIPVSMLDLQELLNCNVEQISMALMCKAVGIMFGSISGATVSDRYRHHTDVALFVFSAGAGVANIAIPWSPNLIVLGALMFAQGVGHGTINVVCSSVTIGEWGEKSAAPVNLLHTFFSFGTLLAPPTTAPFLSKNHETHNSTAGSVGDYMGNLPWTWPTIVSDLPERTKQHFTQKEIYTNFSFIGNNTMSVTNVYIPFAFQGGLAVVVGLLFLIFYMAGWKYQSAEGPANLSSNDEINNEPRQQIMPEDAESEMDIQGSDRTFTILMVLSLLVIYVGMINRDASLGCFNFYIGVKSLGISKPRAAIYGTVYCASWVVGRIFGTIVAKFLRVHWLVFGGVFFALIDSIFLVFFGLHSELLFWILTCGIGIFSGPCYPSVMAWSDNYIVVKGFVVAVIDIGIGLGAMMATWLGGYLLQHYGPISIFIIAAAGTGCMAIVLVPLQIACSIHGNRFKKDTTVDISQSCHADN